MLKFSIITLSAGLTLCATQSTAESDLQTAIQLAILGTQSGAKDGVFSMDAFSISVGLGSSVLGGTVVDPATGALGTAISVGEGDLTDGLQGFDPSSKYETTVCFADDGCLSE